MPSNPESFNKDNAGESAGETSRATFAERGRKVYEVVISEMSSREILDMIDNGEFDAVENETAEQKAARLEKAREARAKLVEEREKLYGKSGGEVSAAETSTAEAPAEAPAETQAESSTEAPTEIAEAVAAQEEAPDSLSAEEIAAATAGAAVAGAAVETAATEEIEKSATAEKEELADAELEDALDEADAYIAAAEARRKAWEESKTKKARTPETTEATAEQDTNQSETISEAEAREILNKAEENPTLRNRALKLFLALAAASALIPTGVAGVMYGVDHDSNLQQTQSEQVEKGNVDESQEASIGESQEAEIGIKDGYGEYGMFLSENKGTPNDFASAAEVAEKCTVDNKIDETEMVIYTADNQVESMADYIANLPEELQPEGFKGLTILETEQKLQSLSDEEYEKVQQQFNDIMDEAFVRDVTLDGDYQNAYMRLIDPSKPATHDNMELVACTTHEQGITVKEFVWYEGNNAHNPVIGSMIVKIIQNEDGSISGCMQVVNQVGSPVYDGMTPFTPDQPDPGTGSEDTGSEGTGSEGTGSEGTGSEGTGSEGTGSEGTGSEDTGSEGTGSEGTDIQEKSYEEMERIDNQILDDIADDIGTDKVTVEQTSTAEVESQPVTEQPSGEDYQGTEPTIVQNETVQQAEPIQEQVSEVNNTSEDLGRANPLPENAVQENQQAQSQADARGDTAASQSQIASELGDILN